MDQRSPRHVAKLVLSVILLLWQLGFECTSQTVADGLLDDDEVNALDTIASSLELRPQPYFRNTFCKEESASSVNDIGISCDCKLIKDMNKTVCHINEISLSNRGLTGVVPKQIANLTYLEILDLSDNKLHGPIPDSLGNLSSLYKLDLSYNQLTGPIPPSLGNLKSSVTVSLQYSSNKNNPYKRCSVYRRNCRGLNSLAKGAMDPGLPGSNYDDPKNAIGPGYPQPVFPSALLVEISFSMDLSHNQLSERIPESIGNLTVPSIPGAIDDYWRIKNKTGDTNIKNSTSFSFVLDFSHNQLIGPIPESLGNLNYLTTLDLHNNFLSSFIPPSLGKLSTSLTYLYLGDNELSHELPSALGNLTKLSSFSVRSNNIDGSLPKSYANLTDLSTFSISGNEMVGPLPDFIANWSSISILSLHGNNFEGHIPSGIFNLSYLQFLMISDVRNSDFQFPLSSELSSKLSNLNTLILRNCAINGQIPQYIANMSSLRYLDLSSNNLYGSIPDSLATLKSLKYMSFAKNKLDGKIPPWIHNATRMKMDLSYNQFSELPFDPLPEQELNLFGCCCNSSTCLPKTIGPVQNKCAGGKPNYHSLFINCGGDEISIDGSLYEQDDGTSQFKMSQKGNWAYSSSGDFLDVNYNSSNYIKSVKCGIPVSDAPLYQKARSSPVSLTYYGFCLREGNYTVKLHFAESLYTGDDDDQATDPSSKIRVFDVYIQGVRKLKDFNIREKEGLDKVHIQNFTDIYVNNSVLEIHFYWAGKGSLDNEVSVDNGPLVSAISVTPNFPLHAEKLSPLHITLITVASTILLVLLLLLFAWIMGWLGKEDLQEINIGLEKPVTLRQLKDATRNFSERNKIGQGGFGTVYKAELQGQIVAVKRLSTHSEEKINELKNEFYTLKSLIHDNLVRLLDVYNGKGQHLLVYEFMQNNSLAYALFDSRSNLKLDWGARYNICLGIASGLVYLHEHPRLKMVHSDIKAANILLDGKLKAKISDFGLAKLHTGDDQIKFFKVEVPQGYMSPEYIQGVVTDKADVYSFGVVLLEIVSGRKNMGQKQTHETEYLLDTAYDLHSKGRLLDLVDKKLSGAFNQKEAIILLKLAVKCTSISHSVRPTMSQVLSVLVGDTKIEEICRPAMNDGSLAPADSSASMESEVDSTSIFINEEEKKPFLPPPV